MYAGNDKTNCMPSILYLEKSDIKKEAALNIEMHYFRAFYQ